MAPPGSPGMEAATASRAKAYAFALRQGCESGIIPGDLNAGPVARHRLEMVERARLQSRKFDRVRFEQRRGSERIAIDGGAAVRTLLSVSVSVVQVMVALSLAM